MVANGRRIVNEISYDDLEGLTDEEEALLIDAEDAFINWTDMRVNSIKLRIDMMRKRNPRSGVRARANRDTIEGLKELMKSARKEIQENKRMEKEARIRALKGDRRGMVSIPPNSSRLLN